MHEIKGLPVSFPRGARRLYVTLRRFLRLKVHPINKGTLTSSLELALQQETEASSAKVPPREGLNRGSRDSRRDGGSAEMSVLPGRSKERRKP